MEPHIDQVFSGQKYLYPREEQKESLPEEKNEIQSKSSQIPASLIQQSLFIPYKASLEGKKVIHKHPFTARGALFSNLLSDLTDELEKEKSETLVVSKKTSAYLNFIFYFLTKERKDSYNQYFAIENVCEKKDAIDYENAIYWKLVTTNQAKKITFQRFQTLSKEVQESIVYSVEHAKSICLRPEQIANFHEAIDRLEKNQNVEIVINELLGFYNGLHDQEKETVSASEIRKLSDTSSYTLLKFIRQRSDQLAPKERLTLSMFDTIYTPDAFSILSNENKDIFSLLVSRSLLELPQAEIIQSIDETISNFSYREQKLIDDLACYRAQKVFGVIQKLTKMPDISELLSPSEKALLKMKQLDPFVLSVKELNEIASMLEKYISQAVNYPEYDRLQKELYKLRKEISLHTFSEESVQECIQRLKKIHVTLPENTLSFTGYFFDHLDDPIAGHYIDQIDNRQNVFKLLYRLNFPYFCSKLPKNAEKKARYIQNALSSICAEQFVDVSKEIGMQSKAFYAQRKKETKTYLLQQFSEISAVKDSIEKVGLEKEYKWKNKHFFETKLLSACTATAAWRFLSTRFIQQIAKHDPNKIPFWLLLTVDSETSYEKIGPKLQRRYKNILFAMTGISFVDPLRIALFDQAYPHEKNALHRFSEAKSIDTISILRAIDQKTDPRPPFYYPKVCECKAMLPSIKQHLVETFYQLPVSSIDPETKCALLTLCIDEFKEYDEQKKARFFDFLQCAESEITAVEFFNKLDPVEKARWYQEEEERKNEHAKRDWLLVKECQAIQEKIERLSYKIATYQKNSLYPLTKKQQRDQKRLFFVQEELDSAKKTRTSLQKTGDTKSITAINNRLDTLLNEKHGLQDSLRSFDAEKEKVLQTLQKLYDSKEHLENELKTLLTLFDKPKKVDVDHETISEVFNELEQTLVEAVSTVSKDPTLFAREEKKCRSIFSRMQASCKDEEIQQKIVQLQARFERKKAVIIQDEKKRLAKEVEKLQALCKRVRSQAAR